MHMYVFSANPSPKLKYLLYGSIIVYYADRIERDSIPMLSSLHFNGFKRAGRRPFLLSFFELLSPNSSTVRRLPETLNRPQD
jgi:hypothetical protein